MKKRLTTFVAILAALTLIFSSAAVVFAADPAGVIRGGDTQTFLKDAPIGTITVHTNQMNIMSNEYSFSTTNSENFGIGEEGRTAGRLVYKNPNGWKTGEPAFDVDGSASLTFPGAATLQDGSKADVVVTYSNMHIAPATTGNNDVTGPVNNITGAFIGPSSNNSNGTNANGDATYPMYGLRCDINVKVLKDGSPVSGTVLFSTRDLDVNGNANLYDADSNDNYKEAFQIVSGAVSDAYIPETNFAALSGGGSAGSANGVKMFADVNSEGTWGDDNTYNTGFAVLTDASSGVTLRWWGKGDGMGTSIFTGNISHGIDSTTTKGGTIKTSTTGKIPGSDGAGDELGPVHIDVPDGKDVSYIMEPEDGYELGTITIDGTVINPDDSSTWPSFIEVTKDANGNPIVTFKDNAADHTIDVSWNPIVTASSGSGGSITDPGDTTVDAGGSKTYTATPEKGYTLGKIKFNGEDVDPSDPSTWPTDDDGNPLLDITENEDGTYSITLSNVTDPTSLEVTLDPIVTASSGAGGSISDPGDTPVESGGSKTYTFTPEPGYEPDKVIVNGKEVTPTKNDDGTWSYTLENVTEPTTIEVTWKKTEIPVTFIDPITGETIDSQSVQYGDPAKEPEAPYHPGYTFKGWDKVFDEITGETVIRAIYEPNTYTIKYDANGGTGTMSDQTFSGTDAVAASKPNAFTREGYNFIGFKVMDKDGNYLKDENGKDLIFKDIHDFKAYFDEYGDGAEVTLVAQWEKITPITKFIETITPKTGDDSNIGGYALIGLTAALALTVLGRKRLAK